MSWSSEPGRSLLRRAGLFWLLVCLPGCGFSPLYGGERGAGLARDLAAVDVARIDAPYGVELRNHILDTMPLPSLAEKPRYRLAIELSTRKVALITARDARARRFDMIMLADFQLRATETGATVTRGTARAEVGYNILDEEDFANLIAERNAGRQAAREVSREIVSRLALYFDRAAKSQE